MKRRNFLKALCAIPLGAMVLPTTPTYVPANCKDLRWDKDNKVWTVERELWLSPEEMEEIQNWQVDPISEQTKRDIFTCGWRKNEKTHII